MKFWSSDSGSSSIRTLPLSLRAPSRPSISPIWLYGSQHSPTLGPPPLIGQNS
ncbi:hypothetical protein PISMIDRAFT_682463 [Pisolithus microcarpus 441]|uniref:Unplaced genomic scaffold scaffold_86, whole genome shotgun sequence n=1 Tax=Pisolithus microcarpus 441 TaxID=765257 RepID=A0A0C9ZJR1_9AGAM|nr:hypothetical protein PISMIDRAFT_682463 [Pisolithus microcarpus 441]